MVAALSLAVRDSAALTTFWRFNKMVAGLDKRGVGVSDALARKVLTGSVNDYPSGLPDSVMGDLKATIKYGDAGSCMLHGKCRCLDGDKDGDPTGQQPWCTFCYGAVAMAKQLSDRIDRKNEFSANVITLKTGWPIRFFEDVEQHPDVRETVTGDVKRYSSHDFVTVKSVTADGDRDKTYEYEIHLDRMAQYLELYIAGIECKTHGVGKCAEAGQKGCIIGQTHDNGLVLGINRAISLLDTIHIALLGRFSRTSGNGPRPGRDAIRLFSQVEEEIVKSNFDWSRPIGLANPVVIDISPDGPDGKIQPNNKTRKESATQIVANLKDRLIVCQEVSMLRNRFVAAYNSVKLYPYTNGTELVSSSAVSTVPGVVMVQPGEFSIVIARQHDRLFGPMWEPPRPEPEPVGPMPPLRPEFRFENLRLGPKDPPANKLPRVVVSRPSTAVPIRRSKLAWLSCFRSGRKANPEPRPRTEAQPTAPERSRR